MTLGTICVDIDNTLANYTNGLREYVQETCKLTQYTCPDPDKYDFSQVTGWPFTGDSRANHYWHKRAVADGMYKTMRPYTLAPEIMRQLHREGWRLIISTTRNDDPTKQSERWLKDNNIPFDGLHYGDKLDIRADVLIDDNPSTLNRATNRLILHPAHEYCKDAKGVNFTKWAEVPDLIFKLTEVGE
ncbi:2-C-methyl-D-erythritol 4-phosphate cytidylyltransferase [Bifidobacterium sp. SO1]|uniref:5' nucleotidase, NT5C type n=1 Tax=Bifidobacterium sp. SO1 TaxID=2809029 RepID=UPI001BDC4005|nr:2-C-methyl-D-erythritol 4-phosphate cytidylyltransferase [Bifidobacterium sp. SO1]MBT1162859.1 2-C-methyl-D-erythritol 4-phosphate cytidylyltransferase [Bifidobacterium sp. SO1]